MGSDTLDRQQLEVKALLATQSNTCKMCLLIPCRCGPILVPEPAETFTDSTDLVREPVEKPAIVSRMDEKKPQRSVYIVQEVSNVVKPHQISGIGFLQDALAQNTGVLLADYMGLGKTLQVLATIYTYLISQNDKKTCVLPFVFKIGKMNF